MLYVYLAAQIIVLLNLTQLVWIMNNICKDRGSNPDHHKKKVSQIIFLVASIKFFLGKLPRSRYLPKIDRDKINLVFIRLILRPSTMQHPIWMLK